MQPRLSTSNRRTEIISTEWGVYPNPISIPNTTNLQSQEGSFLPLVIIKLILVHGLRGYRQGRAGAVLQWELVPAVCIRMSINKQ